MLTLIRCPFQPRVTAVARKRPRSCRQKCRWQVTPEHAYTLDPTKSERADYAAVQASCGNLSGNELTRNLSGNIRPQSSQPAEPLWTDPELNSGISARANLASKQTKKSAGGERIVERSSKILASEVKATTPTTYVTGVLFFFSSFEFEFHGAQLC